MHPLDIAKYIVSIYAYQLNRIIPLPQFKFHKSREYQFITAILKHTNLAKHLEKMCNEREGFILFSEYAEEVVYGKYGFYNRHSNRFGKTDTHNRWPKAIVNLCKKENYTNIVEFGPGDGSLGVNILKLNNNLSWTGIEINSHLHSVIKNNFKKNNLSSPPLQERNNKPFPPHTLIILPYCLDSIAPEIFVNTTDQRNIPNAIIGLTIKNGVLREIPLTTTQLRTRHIIFKDGTYTRNHSRFMIDSHFDVSKWKLYSMQKAYIPVNELSYLEHIAKYMKENSAILIMDEMHDYPLSNSFSHYLLPRDLDTFSRDCLEGEKTYINAGDILYYFPSYFHTTIHFLKSLGFKKVDHDIEQSMAYKLEGKARKLQPGFYLTTAVFAQNKTKVLLKEPITLDFSL